jgi:hypothetical protein
MLHKRIFWLLTVAFALLFGFSYLVQEPYPSFILPGFGRAPIKTEGLKCGQVPEFYVLFDTGDSAAVAGTAFFPGFREPAPNNLVRYVFLPTAPAEMYHPDTLAAQNLYGKLKATRTYLRMWAVGDVAARHQARLLAPETRNWLAAHCKRLFPGRQTTALRVRWWKRCEVTDLQDATPPALIGDYTLALPTVR